MYRIRRIPILIACVAALAAFWPGDAFPWQHHPEPAAHHHHGRPGVVVFIGGYFYDPFFGPYPWWPRAAYPYPYYPIYDNRAIVRVNATPKDAGVYVDGFYAGTVHDFNDWFQGLPLPPGGHEIVLFYEGYRTVRDRVYLAPGTTFKLRHTLERLPAGEASEPPTVAPPLPSPPAGTFTPPRTARPVPPGAPPAPPAAAHGTLAVRVEPAGAEVLIDGDRWKSSDGKLFVIQVSAGIHRVEVVKSGYRAYSTDVQVRAGETMELEVSLTSEKS